jgi:hypothetical protein
MMNTIHSMGVDYNMDLKRQSGVIYSGGARRMRNGNDVRGEGKRGRSIV